jgi:hypothetical protein
MEEQHKNTLKVYNFLSVVLAIIVLINIWCFYSLKKSYETNMAKIMERTTVIEKEIVDCINCPTVFETTTTNDTEDLREYIATQYPKVMEKDISVIVSEINKHSLRHGISFPLIAGLIDVESSYNKFAKSDKDSHGLMQIRYKVWGPKLGIKHRKDLHRIKVNIGLGVGILKYYIDQNNGNVTKALQDYNGMCNNKFSDKVYKAVNRFIEFRSVYKNDVKKDFLVSSINPHTEKVKSDGKSKNRKQPGSELGKGKRLSTSPSIQRKHTIVHK